MTWPDWQHRRDRHRTGLPRHWSRDGKTTHDGVDPARCEECRCKCSASHPLKGHGADPARCPVHGEDGAA